MSGQEVSPPQELLGHGTIVGSFCIACVAIGYSWVIYKVLSRNWYDLKPCHVLQANYLFATVLILVFVITVVLSKEHLNQHLSVLHLLHVSLSMKLYLLQALVLLQLERYLAVRRPFLSEEITVQHTGRAIAVSLFISLALTAIAVVMDWQASFINPVSIYMVSYPKLLAILLTLMVSAALTKEVHRLNAVHPQLQLQPQPQLFQMARPEFQAPQSELEPQQPPLQPPPPETQLPTTQNQPNEWPPSQNPQSQQYSTSQQPLSHHPPINHPTSCLPGLNGLKRDIKMNLLTLMLLFGNLPRHLLFIFIYLTTSEEEEVDSFRTFVLITRFVNILTIFVHCILIVSMFKN